MEKVKPEVIIINDEDDDDDKPECKPTRIKKKLLKKKRKVERTINSSSNTESLVITQKVRKQKFKCIINLTNVCEHKKKKKRKVKPSSTKINTKEVKKNQKIVPNCLRKKCKMDVKRKYDNSFSRTCRKELDKSCGRVKTKSLERKMFNYSCAKREDRSNMSSQHKKRKVQPRRHSHTRYLSPISSDSLSDISSEFDEDVMSYEDISSDSTTEIETLIKRTKDREKKSSVNRSSDYEHNPALPRTSTLSARHNTSGAMVTKAHEKINDLHNFENIQLEINKCRKKLSAVESETHSQKYDCIKNFANIPIPKTDKPSHVSKYIIDIDGAYEPNFTSTPKQDDIEMHDVSTSDGGTVLTGEMDIVSFHSQGTLVLDTFYSPNHPTGSPSLIYDKYSPIMSPAFFHENTPTNTYPSHFMSPHFDSRTISYQNSYDAKKLTEVDTIEVNVKQEQCLKSNEVKVEHASTSIDEGSTTIVATNFDSRTIKVEGAAIPEKWTNETIFKSSDSYVDIKEEFNEDSNNNTFPFIVPVRDLSMRISNNFEDVNLRIKKKK